MLKRLAAMARRSVPMFSLPSHLIVLVLILVTNSGCSVYMAAKQPDAKDLSVLKIGNHRSRVIAEFGAPIWTGDKDGDKTDVFVFKHGYGAASRTGRALFHATADVFSLGLWEAVSTPTEAYFSGSDFKVEIAYDLKDLVKSTQDLTGQFPEINSKPVPPVPKIDKSKEPQQENSPAPATPTVNLDSLEAETKAQSGGG